MESIYYPIIFLICHFVGDYILQSDWMALNKSKKTVPCLVHCLIYTACFLILTTSWKAILLIFATHFVFDRFPIIIRRLIWCKNHFPTMQYPPFHFCDTTGYYDDSPYNTVTCLPVPGEELYEKFGKPRHFFITFWLYIISDNIIHLICNMIALLFFM